MDAKTHFCRTFLCQTVSRCLRYYALALHRVSFLMKVAD